ncbi:MAG: 2-C-methyl-D-erythritol 4-phosphate cytidylyltransferase [Peptococcaceae bacterium]|jgi:2-C-methyl-D-erythritol 4-phosphate cytidylyltransferase|nr:2-C-methyl-D-erythritol 4-phosphate cytidylyltransferase [Peptococcaceae bacterium]
MIGVKHSEENFLPSVTALIVAGGKGTRMGYEQNKLFLPLDESCILGKTLTIWQHISQVDRIVVVCAEGEEEQIADICRKEQISKVEKIVLGGKERQDSVWQGLNYIESLTPTPDVVVIHDGARPFYHGADFADFVQAVLTSDVAGGVLGVPLQDTVKTVSQGCVGCTVPREDLIAVQTPQLFRFTTLYRCYEKAMEAGIVCTDDAGILEVCGKAVLIYPGQKNNLKITTPEDYAYGQYLLAREKKGAGICE